MINNLFTPQFCYGIAIFGTFLSALSQFLLKTQANTTLQKGFFSKFLNWRVIVSYFLLFLTLAINQVAMIHVPMAVIPCITAAIFIWIFLLSYFVLKEKVSRRKVLGVALIILGIIISRL